MSTRDESIARHVKQLKKASVVCLVLAWLVWVEFALGVGLGLTVLSEYVDHWGVFVVFFLLYAFLSACLFLASWTLKVIVYIFDELRLVV
jgi:Ni/Fe-hydrogenase subunit HybB-like protein